MHHLYMVEFTETFTFVNPHYLTRSKIHNRGHRNVVLDNVLYRNEFFMARYFTLFT